MPDRHNGWQLLDAELAAWAAEGRVATLWWRDDDAGSHSVETTRLINLHIEFAVPLTLAVVPCAATRSLANAILLYPGISPVVHGYAHINHAPPNAKQAEFGAHRPLAVMQEELEKSMAAMQQLFGDRLQPVLAPPWNRIAPELVPALPALGFCGLSAFRSTADRHPAVGLVQTNCHVDLLYGLSKITPRPASDVLQDLTAHLYARRRRGGGHGTNDVTLFGKPVPETFDPEEPTGILTHHLAHNPQAWELLQMLFKRFSKPECPVRWLPCGEVF